MHKRHSTGTSKLAADDESFNVSCLTSDRDMTVAVRIRPLADREIESGQHSCCQVMGDSIIAIQRDGSGGYLKSEQTFVSEYAFDVVFDQTSTQYDVYSRTAKPYIPNLLNGLNVTVFCYGATGAGKTHTMLGSTRCDAAARNAEEGGIIPNAIYDLFTHIDNKKKTKCFGEDWSVSVSFIEVYNEQVYDLLDPSGKVLALREDPEKGIVSVVGINEQIASTFEAVLELLKHGNKNRKTEATMANSVSSRSHAVLQLVLRHTTRTVSGHESVVESKLSLIDLAGSERASATNNRGVRLQEGANINKSLLALANCINALSSATPHQKKSSAKYRDSKLTHLLKSSLEGNCNLVMIANINPSNATYEDSHNTLKYANRAKNIRVNPTVRESLLDCSWVDRETRLREENELLRHRVMALEAFITNLKDGGTSGGAKPCSDGLGDDEKGEVADGDVNLSMSLSFVDCESIIIGGEGLGAMDPHSSANVLSSHLQSSLGPKIFPRTLQAPTPIHPSSSSSSSTSTSVRPHVRSGAPFGEQCDVALISKDLVKDRSNTHTNSSTHPRNLTRDVNERKTGAMPQPPAQPVKLRKVLYLSEDELDTSTSTNESNSFDMGRRPPHKCSGDLTISNVPVGATRMGKREASKQAFATQAGGHQQHQQTALRKHSASQIDGENPMRTHRRVVHPTSSSITSSSITSSSIASSTVSSSTAATSKVALASLGAPKKTRSSLSAITGSARGALGDGAGCAKGVGPAGTSTAKRGLTNENVVDQENINPQTSQHATKKRALHSHTRQSTGTANRTAFDNIDVQGTQKVRDTEGSLGQRSRTGSGGGPGPGPRLGMGMGMESKKGDLRKDSGPLSNTKSLLVPAFAPKPSSSPECAGPPRGPHLLEDVANAVGKYAPTTISTSTSTSTSTSISGRSVSSGRMSRLQAVGVTLASIPGFVGQPRGRKSDEALPSKKRPLDFNGVAEVAQAGEQDNRRRKSGGSTFKKMMGQVKGFVFG